MCPPFCSPQLRFHNLVPPLLFFSPLIYNIQVSPTKIFNLYITGLNKQTNNTSSTCVIRCNTHEQKQVDRSHLMFQINKETHSVHNHKPNFRKQLTKEQETLFTSNRKSFAFNLMLTFLHTVYSKNRMEA